MRRIVIIVSVNCKNYHWCWWCKIKHGWFIYFLRSVKFFVWAFLFHLTFIFLTMTDFWNISDFLFQEVWVFWSLALRMTTLTRYRNMLIGQCCLKIPWQCDATNIPWSKKETTADENTKNVFSLRLKTH